MMEGKRSGFRGPHPETQNKTKVLVEERRGRTEFNVSSEVKRLVSTLGLER